MESLDTLLVDHNMLSGYLPASYAHLHELRVLSVGASPAPRLLSFCLSFTRKCAVTQASVKQG